MAQTYKVVSGYESGSGSIHDKLVTARAAGWEAVNIAAVGEEANRRSRTYSLFVLLKNPEPGSKRD